MGNQFVPAQGEPSDWGAACSSESSDELNTSPEIVFRTPTIRYTEGLLQQVGGTSISTSTSTTSGVGNSNKNIKSTSGDNIYFAKDVIKVDEDRSNIKGDDDYLERGGVNTSGLISSDPKKNGFSSTTTSTCGTTSTSAAEGHQEHDDDLQKLILNARTASTSPDDNYRAGNEIFQSRNVGQEKIDEVHLGLREKVNELNVVEAKRNGLAGFRERLEEKTKIEEEDLEGQLRKLRERVALDSENGLRVSSGHPCRMQERLVMNCLKLQTRKTSTNTSDKDFSKQSSTNVVDGNYSNSNRSDIDVLRCSGFIDELQLCVAQAARGHGGG